MLGAVTTGPVAPSAERTRLRPEIQALRAVAALAVVLYHLWPARVTGGYVGVDVFFVISGFLITGLLVRELDRTGRIGFAGFYARRLRRLLPAALLIATTTGLLTFLVVPRGFWAQYFRELLGSTLYAENWVLAADAVDYLAAENSPSPFQHYWSLSVEEQFYIVWPVLLLAGFLLARRRGADPVRWLRVVLAVVLVGSLASSVWLTYRGEPGLAYFATYTRAWQFAAGGLLALPGTLPAPGRRTALWLGPIGWVAILVAVFAFNQHTPFPGYAAALPVLGTALVIWAGHPENPPLGHRWVESRVVRELGLDSYSLYLWHWPLVVTAPFWLPTPTGPWGEPVRGVVLLGLSIGLAAITYRWVEQPLRFSTALTRSSGRTWLVSGVAMALVCGLGIAGIAVPRALAARGEATVAGQVDADRRQSCFGAAARLADDQPCVDPALDGLLVPDPAARLGDIGSAYDCYDKKPSGVLPDCWLGSTRPDALRVAITGDSHAASLLPGLSSHLQELNWRLDVLVGRGCVWSRPRPDTSQCHDRLAALQQRFENGPRYDLIIVTAARFTTDRGEEQGLAELYADAWRPVLERGTRIAVVADNPGLPEAAVACLDRSVSLETAGACTLSRGDAFAHPDPLPLAARLAGRGAAVVDLTDAYCDDTSCPLVIGHVLAYRDAHHITATFSRTLAPFLVERLKRITG